MNSFKEGTTLVIELKPNGKNTDSEVVSDYWGKNSKTIIQEAQQKNCAEIKIKSGTAEARVKVQNYLNQKSAYEKRMSRLN